MSDAVFSPTGLSPTPEQLAIQLDRRRHVIVEANAGAAKTTTLALRLAQALVRGAEVDRILVLTYTEAAVTAVKQALQRIGVAAAVRNRLQILTFDAFCAARLLALEGPGVTQFETPEELKPPSLCLERTELDLNDNVELVSVSSTSFQPSWILCGFACLNTLSRSIDNSFISFIKSNNNGTIRRKPSLSLTKLG